MSKELQRNLKRPKDKRKKVKADEKGQMGALGTFPLVLREKIANLAQTGDLMAKLDFRDEDPTVIDLSGSGGVVSSVQECTVDCMVAEKVYKVIGSSDGSG